MRQPLVLLGAGQHAHVVRYNVIAEGRYEIVAIVDKDTAKQGSSFYGLTVLPQTAAVLAKLEELVPAKNFILAFGSMKARRAVFQEMLSLGWEAVNIIHPSAIVAPNVRLGQGILIECGVKVTPHATIGSNVILNVATQVNHDNVIGDHVCLASGVILAGEVEVGSNCLLDTGVVVGRGLKIGADSLIGAGSVVTKDFPAGQIGYGVPCRPVRPNDKF